MLKHAMVGIALVLGWATVNPEPVLPLARHSAGRTAALTESQKVEQLIEWVRNLKGATFIRNGAEYNCQQAADHLQSKWEKHKDQVKTAEEFIDVLASRSGVSGRDYLIRYANGKTVTSAAALRQQLQSIAQL